MEIAKPSLQNVFARRSVRFLAAKYYPRIEITGAEKIPQAGPVLICANHANSLIDPVLIGIAAGRPVRFLAKAPLFETPLLGPVMHALGMIPVFRGSDDSRQVRRNLESLDTAAEVLVEGHAMGIFPEGKSHDAAQVEMVRSGASRIAIQAAEKGAVNLKVIPLGINYEHKEDFRSSVWIVVGEPIDVTSWLGQHDGETRKATRALTGELESRLKDVVVHLDEPAWEPYLEDLEVLFSRKIVGNAAPVRQRKRIADAMNYFLKSDPDKAESAAEAIATYRGQVHNAGIRVNSPILRSGGLPMVGTLVWQIMWLLLLYVPAVTGMMFHIVPFTFVRAIAAKLRPPGRTTVSLWRLGLGLPIYGLWYAAAAWWVFDYFSRWFAITAVVSMPILGVISLQYWRGARKVAFLWWHQLRFGLQRKRLNELRCEQAELQQRLQKFGEEYQKVSPRPEPPVKRFGLGTLGKVACWLLATFAITTAGWFTLQWVTETPFVDMQSGLNLAAFSTAEIEDRMRRDEKSLRDIIRGLDDLEARALSLQNEFAAGKRNYKNEDDNDAVRQLLLSYINYRSALIRLVWKYQRHGQLSDEKRRLRAFLLDFAAACVLCESSMKFVYQFNRSEETVARLNEGEPVWNIPPGFYDRIEANLSNRASRNMLESARQYYHNVSDRFDAVGLGDSSDHQPFHAAIAQSEETVARLGGPIWLQKIAIAFKDVEKLGHRVHYDTQSVISTWIGDIKIREPRDGRTLIAPKHLEQIRKILKPGDILLERRNWYMSNAFLPGYWPHAALYVGTADDLKELGLDEDPRVRRHWKEFSSPDYAGHRHVIVEAVSEGVLFSSLEHSIGGGDSAAVLRPNLSREEIKEAIARGFSQAGKPYDFEFDFESRDKLVCTEVVFRSYGANNGPLHFPLKNILGRQTMPAIEMVRKFDEERGRENAELEFIAFIDGSEETGTSEFYEDADMFVSTLKRPALTFLQGFEKEPIKTVGPLGWSLLVLIAVFTLGNLGYYLWKRPW